MSKTIIKDLGWCETRVNGDNTTTITLVGHNTSDGKERVILEKMDTFYLSHIADEIAQAMVKVRNKVQKDIDSVKQSLE